MNYSMDRPAEDQVFRTVMAKSDLKLTDPNFEETVMCEIRRIELQKGRFAQKIRLSWACFMAGSVFGVASLLLLTPYQLSPFGMNPVTVQLGLQFLFALAILLSLDQLVTTTSKLFRTDYHIQTMSK